MRHDPDLYAPFLLVILAGPRRGEAVGLRADQVDFTERTVTFSLQLTTYGYTPAYKKVKTRNGDRVVFIDHHTAGDLTSTGSCGKAGKRQPGFRRSGSTTAAMPLPPISRPSAET